MDIKYILKQTEKHRLSELKMPKAKWSKLEYCDILQTFQSSTRTGNTLQSDYMLDTALFEVAMVNKPRHIDSHSSLDTALYSKKKKTRRHVPSSP